MTIVFARRSSGGTVLTNTDMVINSIPIPEDCVLHKVDGHVHVKHGGIVSQDNLYYYGMAGFIIPIEDPDTAVALDTIWDLRVPKDADWSEDSLDLDTGAATAAPEFEPGEGQVFSIINEDQGLREIFRRRKTISVASMGIQPVLDTTWKYYPMDYFSLNVNKSYRAHQHSMAMFGFSSPATVDITTTLAVMPSEVEWNMLKFVDTVVEDAWKALSGLGDEEAVSVTLPFETAMLFLANFLEPDIVHSTGSFLPSVPTWDVFMEATYKLWVPGNFNMKTLTSEG